MPDITKNVKSKKVHRPKRKITILLVTDWVVKTIVYLAIFVTSVYGQRQMLESIQPNVSIVLSGVFTLVAVYIIFRPTK